MTYNELLKSPILQDYFNKRYSKWAGAYTKVLDKNNLTETEFSPEGQKVIMRSISFSWLGLFFNLLWLAYHDGKNWLGFCIIIACFNISMGLVAQTSFELYLSLQPATIGISLAPVMLGAMYFKSWIFSKKLEELDTTKGMLTKTSWARVVGAFSILTIGSVTGSWLVTNAIFL